MPTPELKVFNNYIRRIPIDGQLVAITLFGSNSAGNSVLLDPIHVLIDIGFGFSKYPKNTFYDVDWIFLTHTHGDHYNESTLKHVLDTYSHIKILVPDVFVLSDDLKTKYDNRFQFINTEDKQSIIIQNRNEQLKIIPIRVKHGDITNIAYDITLPTVAQYEFLYATDLQNTDNLPNKQFDMLLLEANYDELDLPEEGIFLGNYRHLSEQQAQAYVTTHLKDRGVYIPLHSSYNYGTYHQTGVIE